LEEQVRGVRFERQVAEFVDDQQLRLGIMRQTLATGMFFEFWRTPDVTDAQIEAAVDDAIASRRQLRLSKMT
jgi:hypothetical protein